MSSSMLLSLHYTVRLQPRRNLSSSAVKLGPFRVFPPPIRKPINHIASSCLKPNPSAIPFEPIKPYLVSQSRPMLLGWLCSAISAFSLSKLVPKIGQLSSNLAHVGLITLRNEGLLLGFLVAAKLVAGYLQQAFLWEAALSAVFKLRLDVFEKVLERDLSFFEVGDGVSSGDIAYRITAEASDVASTLYFLLNVIPCMAFVVANLGERLRKISKKAHMSIAALSAYLNEVLPAVLFVKANNAEVIENARFMRFAHTNLSERLKKKKMKALIPQITHAIYLGALSIIFIGSMAVSRGSIDRSGIVSFIASLVLLIEPIQGIGKAYNELKQGEPAIERLCELSKFKPQVRENPDAITLDNVAGDVRFADVSFKYRDNTPLVLERLNLHIKAGETIALVGPSGGGKTTLAKLLLRLDDPFSGYILIDNHDIQQISLDSLRKHVCLVSQDITLFSGTVAENIGYRALMAHIDMDRVKLAGRLANADEFIRLLPQGYQTNIGAMGLNFKWGSEAKVSFCDWETDVKTSEVGTSSRLAIARAVYQDPSILILDEATTALDSRSELLVRQALQLLMENRTVLVIAHRLETVMMADHIFAMDQGKLQERTRSSLLNGREDALLSSGLVI